jgi:hypothetical protein
MFVRKQLTRVFLFALTIIASCGLLGGQVFGDSYATSSTTQSLIPLSITPECSDASSAIAYWQVDNKNSTDVSISWTNIDNNHTGSFDAPAGNTTLSTYFDSTDPNNTTQFVSAGTTTQTNATEAACATPPLTPPLACVDGSIQQNLAVTWVSPSEVSVATASGAPLCASIQLEFSSYIMPANYNGQGFFTTYSQTDPSIDVVNDTAFPQTVFDNQTVTLAAGTNGATTINVQLPPSCDNTQVDVYYAPEQTVLGPTGNGTANIVSQIYLSSGICASAPPTTGSGSGSTGTPTGGNGSTTPTAPSQGSTSGSSTPVTPAAPSLPAENGQGGKGSGVLSASPATSATQLAYTGASPIVPYLIASSLLLTTATLFYAVRRDATLQR